MYLPITIFLFALSYTESIIPQTKTMYNNTLSTSSQCNETSKSNCKAKGHRRFSFASICFPKALNSGDIIIDNGTISTSTSIGELSPEEDNVQSESSNHHNAKMKIPPSHEWPHRPVLIKASDDSICLNEDGTLSPSIPPVGIPIEFENSLFKGRVLIRIRHLPVPNSSELLSSGKRFHCEEYFQGRKRMRQFVVQGQFKESIPMSDVYFGDIYNKPLSLIPPPFVEKILRKIFHRIGKVESYNSLLLILIPFFYWANALSIAFDGINNHYYL